MNRTVRYALGLLVEEMGEALCHIGRALRFGLETTGQDGMTERDGLSKELGDVVAAIRYSHIARVSDGHLIEHTGNVKIDKLLDPNATDNLGRRLAPDPEEAWSAGDDE